MRNSKKMAAALIMAVSLAFSMTVAKAEEASANGEGTKYITLSDGTVIAYDNTVMNGGIDWEGLDVAEKPDDTQYYTLPNGQVIAYSNTAMNGGIDWSGLESEKGEDGTQYYTLPNGQVIAYNNNVLNGGVDLFEADTSIPESVVIMVPFETQKNAYYSGPAAARMVLGAIGCYRTQEEMAELLHTVNGEGTPAGESVAEALNSVCKGTGFKFTWQWHQPRDYETIRGHIIEALTYGNPVMVNVLEGPGDSYLQGHDNVSGYVGRFGVVADYFDYGNEVTYTDPGAGYFEGFVVDQRITLEDLSKACGGRGYAW